MNKKEIIEKYRDKIICPYFDKCDHYYHKLSDIFFFSLNMFDLKI